MCYMYNVHVHDVLVNTLPWGGCGGGGGDSAIFPWTLSKHRGSLIRNPFKTQLWFLSRSWIAMCANMGMGLTLKILYCDFMDDEGHLRVWPLDGSSQWNWCQDYVRTSLPHFRRWTYTCRCCNLGISNWMKKSFSTLNSIDNESTLVI